MAVTIAAPLTPSRLNPYITEVPQKVVADHTRKASLHNLASKVCLAAFLAIAASAVAISLGIFYPMHPLFLVGLLFSTIPFQIGFQKGLVQSSFHARQAAEAQGRAIALAEIQSWDRSQIETFFKQHKLSLNPQALPSLAQLDRNEPLRALLPAIATYRYLGKQTEKYFEEHLENLHNQHENPAVRLEGRRIGWRILESRAFPAALEAAVVLETIGNPLSPLKLEEIGICRKKEFDQRRFDQLIDGTDEYFVFKDNRKPLTFSQLQEMISSMNLDALRIKLFAKEEKSAPALRR